ncbi:MAG TPA: hypothetical protein PKK69_10915, partial [Ferruginibacter sp.]|nr:hypothetical protein [Ferruginibacter sp.]
MNPNCTLKTGYPYKPKPAGGTAILRVIFFLILLLAIRESAQAQKTWTGSSGNWSDATKWSGGTVPTSSDNVNLSPSAARTITLDVDVTINNLTVGTNATLSFNAS